MLDIKRRIHLFEFEDQSWFPPVLREGMMDFLRFMITKTNFYEPAIPVIAEALRKTGEQQLLELGAGSGGGALKVREQLKHLGLSPRIILSDLYPQIISYNNLKELSENQIDFIAEPVNAMNVPQHLKGLRIMFSSFHHFKPKEARKILADAIQNNVAIGIFDAGTKSILTIIFGIILLQPFVFFFVTPFIRPFKWSRIFFTYLIPLIPLCTLWDGSVSVLRFYTVRQLNELMNQINADYYTWETGQMKNRIGAKVNYLIVCPR